MPAYSIFATSSRFAIALSLLFCLAPPANAQTDPLNRCLADNTTGKDRKDLARWIFVAMSAHPEIRELASVSEGASDKTSQGMGNLVTQLLTEKCKKEFQTAIKAGGAQALRNAFEHLGQLAMVEIMSDTNVTTSISRFERYLDRPKINAVLGAE